MTQEQFKIGDTWYELGKNAEEVFCVSKFYSEATLKGSYKHHKVPYNLSVQHDYPNALAKLFDMATEEDNVIIDEERLENGWAIVDQSKYDQNDPSKGKIIWEPGDRDVDLGDYSVRAVTVKDLMESYTPMPPEKERIKMGAGIDEYNLNLLLELEALQPAF